MLSILSVQNPAIKALRALKDKKGRKEQGRFLIEGPTMLEEALASGIAVQEIIVEEGAFQKHAPLLQKLGNVPVTLVSPQVLAAVCDTKTPQALAAAISINALVTATLPKGRAVLLDGVSDPGNIGTIWRTAEAAGFEALVLSPDAADPFSPKVIRATMGAIFRVPVLQADLSSLLEANSHRAYAAVLEGENLYQLPPADDNALIVIGSEAHGVRPHIKALCAHKVRLPMQGAAESLNAAVAAGILMYHLAYEGKRSV